MIRNQALICALRLTCFITMMTVAGCGHRSSTLGGADLVIASKSFPESQLLAEIMAQLIEAQTELRVDRKEGLGGTMVCFEALRTGLIPGTLNLQRSDPAISLPLTTENTSSNILHVMSNSFGFGGNNACLIFSAIQ